MSEQHHKRRRLSRRPQRRLPTEILEQIYSHIPDSDPFTRLNFAVGVLQQHSDYATDKSFLNSDGHITDIDKLKTFRTDALEKYKLTFDEIFLDYAISKKALIYHADWDEELDLDKMFRLFTMAVIEDDLELANESLIHDYILILTNSEDNFCDAQPARVHQYLVRRFLQEVNMRPMSQVERDFVLTMNNIDIRDAEEIDEIIDGATERTERRKDPEHLLNLSGDWEIDNYGEGEGSTISDKTFSVYQFFMGVPQMVFRLP